MHITRLYADAAGVSHFADLDLPLDDSGPIGRLSQRQAASGVIFRETDPDYDYDWHTAPQRQFIIMLSGTVEIEAGDGEVRRFGPGAVLLAEDTSGRGHRSRTVDGQPRQSIFVTLE